MFRLWLVLKSTPYYGWMAISGTEVRQCCNPVTPSDDTNQGVGLEVLIINRRVYRFP